MVFVNIDIPAAGCVLGFINLKFYYFYRVKNELNLYMLYKLPTKMDVVFEYSACDIIN